MIKDFYEKYLNRLYKNDIDIFFGEGSKIVITSLGYSTNLKQIHMSAKLFPTNSEFAIELLSKSDFKEGITSSIPSNINVAEKFGESGDLNTRQMHETAIIYLNERPYLLTIMTKGKEINNLPEVIKKTSYAIYSQMNLLNNK